MDPAWVAALVALVVAVCTGGMWAARWGWRLLRQVARFLDDYFGEAAHDGLEGKPGVMARLKTMDGLISRVVAETTPNGGSSLRDVVARTAADVADIKTELSSLRERTEQLEHQRIGRERRP